MNTILTKVIDESNRSKKMIDRVNENTNNYLSEPTEDNDKILERALLTAGIVANDLFEATELMVKAYAEQAEKDDVYDWALEKSLISRDLSWFIDDIDDGNIALPEIEAESHYYKSRLDELIDAIGNLE